MKLLLLCHKFLFLLCLLTNVYAKKPNVLLILLDDLKPVLGTYNYANAHTPNIDRLAEQSFVFTNAYAQQALCAPSRNSFLTSRRPDTLRLYDFYSYWRDAAGNFTTLPQHFKENGYYARSIGKVFHPGVSSNFTDDAKFSWSDRPYHPPTEVFQNANVCPTVTGDLVNNLNCPVIVDEQPGGSLPDLQSLKAATEFLTHWRNYTRHLPYFLAVGFHKPHVPLKFPVEYLQFHPLENVTLPTNRRRPSALPTVAWNPWNDVRKRFDVASLNVPFPFGPMPDDMSRKIIQHYDAATTYVDDLIGQLLRTVENNTIVILTSDHGWQRGEHGEFAKYSNFAEATRVPLIIHVPVLNKGRTIINDLVELVDLFPTLVDLTQVSQRIKSCALTKHSPMLCTEGSSLVPLMYASERKHTFEGKRAVFTQYPRPGTYPTSKPNSDEPKLHNIAIMGYTIRTQNYRYTEWVDFNHTTFTPDWNAVFAKELYDRLFDSDENENLADRPELKFVMENLKKDLILGWRHFN